jgi:hypothetical protein
MTSDISDEATADSHMTWEGNGSVKVAGNIVTFLTLLTAGNMGNASGRKLNHELQLPEDFHRIHEYPTLSQLRRLQLRTNIRKYLLLQLLLENGLQSQPDG